MDYFKNRCPVCFNSFCCGGHKDAHLKKTHPDHHKKLSQGLLKMLSERTEYLLIKERYYLRRKSQHTRIATNRNLNMSRLATKRLHSDINKQTVTKSIVITEARKVLVPVRKLQKNIFLSYYIQEEKQSLVEINFKTPPFDSMILKTSTPIVTSNYIMEDTPKSGWNLSQTSSISAFQTPSGDVGSSKPSFQIYETPSCSQVYFQPKDQIPNKFQLHGSKGEITTPRSIITKISKYDLGPSPNLSTSKNRRVTFSFGSPFSSSLDSVPEVEICKDLKNDCFYECDGTEGSYIVVSESILPEGNENDQSDHICNQPIIASEPTLSDDKKTGFFNCVTDLICSAVPKLASWRRSSERFKHIQRPDRNVRVDIAENPADSNCVVEEIRSPELKQICYLFDLRENPIKSRRPISYYY